MASAVYSSCSLATVGTSSMGTGAHSYLVGCYEQYPSLPLAPAKRAIFVSASASKRPLWFPGSTPPASLDGSLPEDFGFDPLRLGSEPELLKWFIQAEIIRCRWAMLGAAGIFISEALTKAGIMNTPSWYSTGEAEYFADPTTLRSRYTPDSGR
ncbi:hypothetical protein KP509_12G094100 [Ceratopteris richardii]|uniref:Chlorophyll a-b binding protein, chloroplastic n=1 Tax=Ceratopteris richardii TaxID=49495 RepID=A0A8T2TRW4_CERRI|nr:hypothetical protein KP509_12G094100 [Ceratopteris richardii]